MNTKESRDLADKESNKESNSYLVFQINGEHYGTPLLDIREVIEFQPPKHVPNMDSAFMGVINLRGTIIGVIDLRRKFGLKSESSKQSALLVCQTEKGTLAALADRVDSVQELGDKDIDRAAPLQSPVPNTFFKGIGKSSEKLITLVDLLGLLAEGGAK